MKISDIISGKGNAQQPQQQQPNDADRLMMQKTDIERELSEAAMVLPQPQQQRMNNYQPQAEPEPDPIPEPPMVENVAVSKKIPFRMTVFLENGQKLPIVFIEYPEEVPGMLKRLDAEIEAGRVVTIGDFKFPAARIMYIDLQGR